MKIGELIRRLGQTRRLWSLAGLVVVSLVAAIGFIVGGGPGGPVAVPVNPTPGGLSASIPAAHPSSGPATSRPGSVSSGRVAKPASSPVGHPRLFFTQEDVPAIRARAAGIQKEIWQPILNFAQSQLGKNPPSMPKEKDLDGFRNAGDQVIAFAFAYVVTGDRRFFDLTRQDLLAYATWQYWGDEQGYGSRDLGFHHILMGVAIAYDWIFNDLSTEDRGTIGKALAGRAQESWQASQATQSQWDNWWRKAYTQNHHWTNHSALGMAALALYGQDSRAQAWLDAAVENLKRDSYSVQQIRDGSWHEGIPYQTYALSMALPFMYNLRSLKGIDIFPHDYLKNYTYWRVYNSLPGSDRFALPVGDVEWSYASSAHGPEGVLRFIAGEYQDGRAEWMARQLLATNGRGDDVFKAPTYVFEFLYFDPAVAPEDPNGLPLARTFPDLEGVIWRTGWGANDLVFGFKTGAPAGRFFYGTFLNQEYPFDASSDVDFFHSGHDHQDANGFYLYRGKVDLSSERADYGKKTTSFHNSLLVDGKGQTVKDTNVDDPRAISGRHAELTAVGETNNFDYLLGDATDRYDNLEQFGRYVLFVRPNYLVMVDSIRANARHRYEWVSHFAKSVSQEGDWLKGVSEDNNVLGVKILAPSAFSVSKGEDGKPYVRVRPTNDVQAVRFATVLFPTSADKWNDKPEITSLGDSGQVIGVRVALEGEQDHLIRYGDAGTDSSLGDYSLDGMIASVARSSDGMLQRVLLGQGRRLADSGGRRVLVQASEEISTIEVEYSGSSLALSGETARGLRIYAPGVDPKLITLNGQPVRVSQNGDYVEIS